MKIPRVSLVLGLSLAAVLTRLSAAEGGVKPESRERTGNGGPSRQPSERQAANVFRAYDKNRDGGVTVDEWLAMRHLTPNDQSDRARVERARFQAAGPGADGRMNQKEFVFWYTQGRFNQTREGGPSAEAGAPRRGPRDGDAGRPKGPRDGEGVIKPGPGDGENGPRKGPQDTGGTSPESQTIVIDVDDRGRILNGERRAMDTNQMRAELRRIAATANGRKIYLRADRAVPFQAMQSLLRECQAANIKNLFLLNR